MWFSQSILLCFLIQSIVGDDEVTVTIPQGTLKGIKAFTATQNIPYYSFRGVPFAKPRVGPTKFDLPESPEPWEGVWDATKHRAKCPYWCMMEKGVMGDEDCLHLNVYSTDLNSDAKKAVLVWFPTGGYNAGSGNDDLYGPDFFIDQDVILVTPNYRLGPLGFISTQDEIAPGNAGMKDQVMALKWVQDNIANFGGDPTKVTIFGHSSGSASVQLHMISPMSKGLFSKAVMQAGSALNDFSLNRNPKDAAFKLGKILGINAKSTKDLLKELQKKSHVDIILAAKEVNKEMHPMSGQIFAFVPVIENDQGENVFLPTDPWVAVKSSELADVPLLSGITTDEGAIFGVGMFAMGDALNKHIESFIPLSLNITDAKVKKMVSDSMKKFYFNDKKISFPETEAEFLKMVGDVCFNIPHLMATKIIQSRNKSPVYEYLFSYESSFGVMKSFAGISKYATHGDETGYQFYSNAFKNKPEPNSPAEIMTNKMTKMWANFAKEGNPTAKMDTDVNIQWLPLDKEDNYLNINLDLKMEKGLFSDRLAFWADIYKDVLGDFANIVN